MHWLSLPGCYLRKFYQDCGGSEFTVDGRQCVYSVKEVGPFTYLWMGNLDQTDWDSFPDLPFLTDPKYGIYRAALGGTALHAHG